MSRARNFCITDNNYGDKDIDIFKSLSCIKYGVLGKEVASTGTPHLQGYIQLKQPKTISALQKVLTNAGLRVSVIIARGNWQQNSDYCSKDGDVFEWGEPKKQGSRTDIHSMYQDIKEGKDNYYLQENHTIAYTKYYKACDLMRQNIRENKVKEQLKVQFSNKKLRNWQEKALNKLNKQDDRKVLWIYDREGNKGKTWLAKYLLANKDAFYVQGGKTRDIACAYNYEKYVCFDFTRSQEEYVNYSVIESFKNGLIFSPKYNSITKKFNPCQVIVMSNFYPDTKQLSQDRWDIMTL